MSKKLKHYDVTIFNMNCAKNQDEAERFAISGGLVNLQSGWGVWDSVEVK